MLELITREELILTSIKNYYNNNVDNFRYFKNIIEQKSKISISLIEYFTLKYSKILNTMYRKENGDFFIVYLSYKNFLKGYGKKFTDPFKRKKDKDEVDFYLKIDKYNVKTRIAQLHFFKWAFENEIIEYIENNYDKIMSEMKNKTDKKPHTRVNVFNLSELQK